ncbi:MAG: restriction endonuclease subunit R, partial [Paludibacteraceae bacterium]|nr:restriction endonuclease subunit R [Paludibacteraceae bacterium]
VVNSALNKKSDFSDDISAYELILKNKERLLSFEEPTRFIFSHSALREGWDNPNVFQICTLRHSESTTAKRQEVGRGLRLCVHKDGTRMDAEVLGDEVHEINKLTVIANESYATFTADLQNETASALRERALKAEVSYFAGKQIKLSDGSTHTITEGEASRIIIYLEDNEYIDDKKHITDKYRADVANGAVAPIPVKIQHIAEGVTKLINGIYDPSVLKDLIVEEKTTTPVNKLNENFKEFQTLWNEINHQYVYTVSYDSEELIQKSILHINAELTVTPLRYVMVEGIQNANDATTFGDTRSQSHTLSDVSTSTVKYDLVGDIVRGAHITRGTVVKILKGINVSKLYYFKNNPEEFIRNVITIIKEQKSTMIVDHIHYNVTEGKYENDIFTVKSRADFDKAYGAKKHITDYVFSDSNTEKEFAKKLDEASEVVVYAKLPRSFKIPTPVGNYAPDWAISLKQNNVKHIFFIAETKGSMSSMDLSAIEKAKIDCAKKLFNSISSDNVKYHEVDSFETLRNLISDLK